MNRYCERGQHLPAAFGTSRQPPRLRDHVKSSQDFTFGAAPFSKGELQPARMRSKFFRSSPRWRHVRFDTWLSFCRSFEVSTYCNVMALRWSRTMVLAPALRSTCKSQARWWPLYKVQPKTSYVADGKAGNLALP